MAYGSIADGAVGIARTEYAQRTRLLIKLITELRALGAQADIDLPRIAVIGNQSAGKSSLVEAISGITVPRASGTCTRCPMECRLQNSSGPWSCQVLLRFEKDEDGQRLPEVHESKFGPRLTDKSKLEDVLRRAQLAILNPSVSHNSFVDFDLNTLVHDEPPLGSRKLLQFSPNVVCLDLAGPDVADLSFIDLPGIISNVADGENRNNIGLVQGLVKEYIRGNSLILLTLTMRDDLENQSAAFLAKETDPEGTRTIGVLTKADTVLRGEEPAWLKVLEGERHALKHGYYVTKQPGPEELSKGLSFEDARERERSFFSGTSPWNSSSSRVKSRTGIPNLTKELSKLLSHLIMQTLPRLRQDAQQSRDATLKALAALPPPLPENPVTELLRLVTSFSNATNEWIRGAERHEGLLQKYRAANVIFKAKIRQTAPDLRPFESPEAEKSAKVKFHNRLEDDPSGLGDEPFGEETDRVTPMYLPQVRDYVQNSLTRHLPFNVPFAAKRGLIERSFTTWNDHASTYFDTVCHAASEQLNEIIEDHFARFAMSPLRDHVRNIVDEQVNRHRNMTSDRIAWFLELERPPFTQNRHYLSSLRDAYLSKYRAVREELIFNPNGVSNALGALAQLGFKGLKEEDLHKLYPRQKYEEELIVMAEVSAYFRVSYKRIIDDVPRIVDNDFLRALGKDIQGALIDGVGLGSDKATERATMYLTEDPDIVERRAELLAKKQRLDGVLEKLFSFGI